MAVRLQEGKRPAGRTSGALETEGHAQALSESLGPRQCQVEKTHLLQPLVTTPCPKLQALHTHKAHLYHPHVLRKDFLNSWFSTCPPSLASSLPGTSPG